jgi:hypothetical protein
MATKTQPLHTGSRTINGILFETRTYAPAKGQYQCRTVYLVNGVRVTADQYSIERTDARIAEFVPATKGAK